MSEERKQNELVLPIGFHAYGLDETKGKVVTYVGPSKTSLGATDKLVIFDPDSKKFLPAQITDALGQNIVVPKGSYVILENPAKDGRQPETGKLEDSIPNLKMGEVENIPGPVSFPLWPFQIAKIVGGHHLRSNQYLMVRITDDEAARKNWEKRIVKAKTVSEAKPTQDSENSQDSTNLPNNSENLQKPELELDSAKDALAPGQLFIIRGDQVAFYIPPSGIEVVKDDNEKYVRDAVTLERLEYSILLDEDGNKEYVRGPAVVFPTPTQQFVTSKSDSKKRKFRAFELQEKSGIHIKVIADYEENGHNYRAGEELFITGADQAIYYPRTEHAIISYGGQEKYYGIAIAAGDGRYVLDRKTGDIDLVTGPNIFLPDPRTKVIVQRELTDNECHLYYPGNSEVLAFNRELRSENSTDIEISSESNPSKGYNTLNYELGDQTRKLRASPVLTRSAAPGMIGDSMERGTSYTPPRKITLNSGRQKYEGAVAINVFSGYAVRVIDSKGNRRTVVGPASLLLQYDEKLESLSLSTGKPKTSDKLLNTVYLHISTPISDTIKLKTLDLVDVKVELKYLIRFDEAKKEQWFAIDNYVQYFVDHLRSIIGNYVRGIVVGEFYEKAADILRNLVLGAKTESGKRPLMQFSENGMEIYDVELISISIENSEIAGLVSSARHDKLKDAISLEVQQQKLIITQGKEEANRQIMKEVAETKMLGNTLASEVQQWQRQEARREIQATTNNTILEERQKNETEKIVSATKALYNENLRKENEVKNDFAERELQRKIQLLMAEAESSKTRMQSVAPALVEALIACANAGILEKVVPTIGSLAFVHGQDLENVMQTIFKGSPVEGIMANLKKLSAGRSI